MSHKPKTKQKRRTKHKNAPGPHASAVAVTYLTKGVDAVRKLEPSPWVLKRMLQQLSESGTDVAPLIDAFPEVFKRPHGGKTPPKPGETRMYTVQQLGSSQFARLCVNNVGVPGGDQVRVESGDGWSLITNPSIPAGSFRVVGAKAS